MATFEIFSRTLELISSLLWVADTLHYEDHAIQKIFTPRHCLVYLPSVYANVSTCNPQTEIKATLDLDASNPGEINLINRTVTQLQLHKNKVSEHLEIGYYPVREFLHCPGLASMHETSN